MDSVQERILAIFKHYDTNGDGNIDSEEMIKVLQEVDKEMFTAGSVEELIKSADVDRDGRISFDEFVDWIFKDEMLVTHTSHLEDGTIVRDFVDGRKRTTFADGCVIDEFTGGVRRQKNAKGVIVINDDNKGTKTTIRTNGVQITTHKDGKKVQSDLEGRVITTAADGVRTQVDPDGVKIVTEKNGVAMTFLLDGTMVERFAEEQSSATKVKTVQLNPQGSVLITYIDGGRVQFDPKDGIQVEIGPSDAFKLQRARDGSALLTKKDAKPEPLNKEAVLKAITEGTYRLPSDPATVSIIEFSSLASAEAMEQAKKVTLEAIEARKKAAADDPASGTAGDSAGADMPDVKETLQASSRTGEATAGDDPADDEKSSGTIVSQEVLKSGTRRTVHSDGRVIERHKDGGVVVVHLSGEKEQTDPDGTVIRTFTDGSPTIQINVDGTSIQTKADGSRSTRFPDGTVVDVDVKGVKMQRNADGTQIQTWPDGRHVQVMPDGICIETLADGSMKQCRKDGSGMTRSADKRDESRYAAGHFKGDINGIVEAATVSGSSD